MDFNLAPLAMRRDIALLGLLHRLDEGPAPFKEYFKRRPSSLRLVDPLEGRTVSLLMRRSIWGLPTLGGALQCSTVNDFQTLLQARVKRIVAKQLLNERESLYSRSPR